jgi:hypothetical protein
VFCSSHFFWEGCNSVDPKLACEKALLETMGRTRTGAGCVLLRITYTYLVMNLSPCDSYFGLH